MCELLGVDRTQKDYAQYETGVTSPPKFHSPLSVVTEVSTKHAASPRPTLYLRPTWKAWKSRKLFRAGGMTPRQPGGSETGDQSTGGRTWGEVQWSRSGGRIEEPRDTCYCAKAQITPQQECKTVQTSPPVYTMKRRGSSSRDGGMRAYNNGLDVQWNFMNCLKLLIFALI